MSDLSKSKALKWYDCASYKDLPDRITGVRFRCGTESFTLISVTMLNDIIAYTLGEPYVESYEGLPPYVLETTHGYYSDYGWGLASTFNELDEAKAKCDFWLSKGGQYRVVSNGAVVYGEPLEGDK